MTICFKSLYRDLKGLSFKRLLSFALEYSWGEKCMKDYYMHIMIEKGKVCLKYRYHYHEIYTMMIALMEIIEKDEGMKDYFRECLKTIDDFQMWYALDQETTVKTYRQCFMKLMKHKDNAYLSLSYHDNHTTIEGECCRYDFVLLTSLLLIHIGVRDNELMNALLRDGYMLMEVDVDVHYSHIALKKNKEVMPLS